MCYVHNQWYDISCATLYIACHVHGFGDMVVIIGVRLVPIFAGVVCRTYRKLRHLLDKVTVIYSSFF